MKVLPGVPRPESALTRIIDASDPEALESVVLTAPSKSKKAAVATLLLRQLEDPNVQVKDVAEELGLSPRTLSAYRALGQREGWFYFTEAEDRLREEAIPKAVDGLIRLLKGYDRETILATLKGLGYFKTHQAAPAIAASGGALTINIEIPTDLSPSKNIISAPKIIEGETLECET